MNVKQAYPNPRLAQIGERAREVNARLVEDLKAGRIPSTLAHEPLPSSARARKKR